MTCFMVDYQLMSISLDRSIFDDDLLFDIQFLSQIFTVKRSIVQNKTNKKIETNISICCLYILPYRSNSNIVEINSGHILIHNNKRLTYKKKFQVNIFSI